MPVINTNISGPTVAISFASFTVNAGFAVTNASAITVTVTGNLVVNGTYQIAIPDSQ